MCVSTLKGYSQKDSRLGDVSELSVEWVPLPKLDEHSNATIKYIKPDGNEDCTIITRKNDEQHPLGWTVIAHPAINTNEGDEDPNIQVSLLVFQIMYDFNHQSNKPDISVYMILIVR